MFNSEPSSVASTTCGPLGSLVAASQNMKAATTITEATIHSQVYWPDDPRRSVGFCVMEEPLLHEFDNRHFGGVSRTVAQMQHPGVPARPVRVLRTEFLE